MEEWKSPRKIEEEVRQYQRDRFEHYMTQEDLGLISRDMAIVALRSEIANTVDLTSDPV